MTLPSADHPVLAGREGERAFLLGNEAIVRGALEAGVGFACGYPGTPSSEITDSFAAVAAACGIEFEYAVNEKIALEAAFGASLAGTRALVAMKHLGLMYAGDPLATIPYVGVRAGFVIVSAGDPACLTSPNEQDQRLLAPMLHLPLFDPATPAQALELTKAAFELSEGCGLPVLLRPTTRVCHARAEVPLGELRRPERRGFMRDPKRLVPVPGNARRLRLEIEERLERARRFVAGRGGFVEIEGEGPDVLLAAGAAAALAHDVVTEEGFTGRLRLVRLGCLHPLPEDALCSALAGARRVLVIEELMPFLEDALLALAARAALGIEIFGKRSGHLPAWHEYDKELIRRALAAVFELPVAESPAAESPAAGSPAAEKPPVPPRPPVLCAACPHRATFFAVRAVFGEEALFFNDIGCYTLGFGPPLDCGDALLAMGSSVPMAAAAARCTGRPAVAFLGDGTFLHSGLPALLDAAKEGARILVVVMDNEVTAMTGFQERAGVEAAGGRLRRRIELESIARALGVRFVETVDPEDLPHAIEVFERAAQAEGTAVVVARRPCAVFARKAGLATEAEPAAFRIDPEICGRCGREASGLACAQERRRGFERAIASARARELPGSPAAVAVAPCAAACPLALCVPGYTAQIAAGDFDAALELILERLPLPETICRVCDRPCERACTDVQAGTPIAVNRLKRAAVDYGRAQPPACRAPNGKRAAVVGAGPAGLAAAWELAGLGFEVDLFDRAPEPGGLLRTAVPAFRLPRAALDRDLERVCARGVRFHGGAALGRELDPARLAQDYDGVVYALGAGPQRALDLPGEGPPLRPALSFLEKGAAEGRGAAAPRRVAVIGGGNAAVDAARCALRTGAAEVTICCLETRDEMPALADEVAEALEEGIVLRTRAIAVRRVPGGLEIARAEGPGGANFDPAAFCAVSGTEEVIGADFVLYALGAEAGAAPPNGVRAAYRGTVVEALAEGRSAARTLARGLGVAPPPEEDLACTERRGVRHALRLPSPGRPRRPAAARRRSFDEVVRPYTRDEAVREAKRCFFCGRCGNCRACVEVFGCPAIGMDGGKPRIDEVLCTGCGVCAALCPNGAIAAVRVEVRP